MKESSLKHIVILESVALALGIYLIATTVLISKDGILFINFAQAIDVDPVGAMLKNYQHPGYPFLIYLTQKLFKIFYSDHFWSFLYSAQTAALICRMGALAILYFIGKKFVGARMSFWAVLILTLLPESSLLGSDALSDWPHILMLSAGILILIKAFENKSIWLFAASGLVAGTGYLIRPECAQLALYGCCWLVLEILNKNSWRQKTVIALAGVLMIGGFLLTAGPYMKLKGAILPKKGFDFGTVQNVSNQNGSAKSPAKNRAALMLEKMPKGVFRVCKKICEVFLYFFAFFIPIGMWQHFRKNSGANIEKFLISSVIVLNIFVLSWLFCRYGYLTRRHALPFASLIVFYIPVGIETISSWIAGVFYKDKSAEYSIITGPRIWFFIFLICGFAVISFKLLKPLGANRTGYRDVSTWLSANTAADDVIIVPDPRIDFYAQRKGLPKFTAESNAKYIVKIIEKDRPNKENTASQVFSTDTHSGENSELIVCRIEKVK